MLKKKSRPSILRNRVKKIISLLLVASTLGSSLCAMKREIEIPSSDQPQIKLQKSEETKCNPTEKMVQFLQENRPAWLEETSLALYETMIEQAHDDYFTLVTLQNSLFYLAFIHWDEEVMTEFWQHDISPFETFHYVYVPFVEYNPLKRAIHIKKHPFTKHPVFNSWNIFLMMLLLHLKNLYFRALRKRLAKFGQPHGTR